MNHFPPSAFLSPPFIGVLMLASMAGCAATAPAPAAHAAGVSADYIGDANRMGLGEVVVSVKFRGASGPYQNLHVLPAVAITQKRGLALNSAMAIVRQMESRIAARLAEKLGSFGEQSIDDAPALRESAKAQVQAVLDGAFKQWKDGEDYQVEAIIESLYWTDASVGRAPAFRGW